MINNTNYYFCIFRIVKCESYSNFFIARQCGWKMLSFVEIYFQSFAASFPYTFKNIQLHNTTKKKILNSSLWTNEKWNLEKRVLKNWTWILKWVKKNYFCVIFQFDKRKKKYRLIHILKFIECLHLKSEWNDDRFPLFHLVHLLLYIHLGYV